MSGDTFNGSENLWGKDIDTTVDQITYLHVMNIVNPNLTWPEVRNPEQSNKAIKNQLSQNTVHKKYTLYIQRSQVSQCSATALW